jgi:hypothetical protein
MRKRFSSLTNILIKHPNAFKVVIQKYLSTTLKIKSIERILRCRVGNMTIENLIN